MGQSGGNGKGAIHCHHFNRAIACSIVWMIRLYQLLIAPILGPRCRFYPSCSSYAILCLRQLPLGIALTRIIRRLAKCQPLHSGGVDFP